MRICSGVSARGRPMATPRLWAGARGSTVFGSKRFRKEQCRPERRSARSSNVCEQTDEPWRLPAEVMCRVQREKTWVGYPFDSGSHKMLWSRESIYQEANPEVTALARRGAA